MQCLPGGGGGGVIRTENEHQSGKVKNRFNFKKFSVIKK